MDSFFTMRRLLVCGFASLLIFSSCTRISSTDVGSGLIPPIDGVHTLDTTFNIITDTYEDLDSIRVFKSDNHVLGIISNDPVFGKTNASLYFEVGASNYPFLMQGVKDSIKVDSAVLVLSYKSAFGDSLQPIKLNVYEINSLMDQYRDYAANYPNAFPISTSSIPLGPSATFDIRRLGDSVINRFEVTKNVIRIKLNKSFATRMILGYDTTTAYKSDSTLRTYFNGFAVIPDPSSSPNALLNINLVDTNTKLALYYSTANTAATSRDTVVTNFRFNTTTSGHANFITRNRVGAEIAQHLSTTPKSDSMVYVQATPGTGVRIRVPGLQNLSNRIIHRAELVLEQVPDDTHPNIDAAMTPPRYLLLSIFDSLNHRKKSIPNSFALTANGPNTAVMGGYLTYKSIQGYNQVAAYSFDLARFVQGIATRNDTAFNLIITAASNDSIYYTAAYPNQVSQQIYNLIPTYTNNVSNGRVRLGGGTHTKFRMRLRVIYSKI